MAIETVLVALTEASVDDRLVEATAELADATGATAFLGRSFDRETYTGAAAELGLSSPDELARRNDDVAAARSRFADAGVECDVRGAVGTDGDGLLELVERLGADRVLVQERERSPAGKAVFGSAAQRVLLRATCPVTYVSRPG